jgi:hypothetical protein
MIYGILHGEALLPKLGDDVDNCAKTVFCSNARCTIKWIGALYPRSCALSQGIG